MPSNENLSHAKGVSRPSAASEHTSPPQTTPDPSASPQGHAGGKDAALTAALHRALDAITHAAGQAALANRLDLADRLTAAANLVAAAVAGTGAGGTVAEGLSGYHAGPA